MSGWLDGGALLLDFDTTGAYIDCAVGLRTINPQRLIGLSRPYDSIAADRRMERLRSRVLSNGWVDYEGGESVHVYLLPDMSLVVGQNGNHRAILAREMGLKRMRVELSVLVPKCDVSGWLMKKYLACDAEWSRCRELYWEADDNEDISEKKRLWILSDRLESRCRCVSAYIGKQYLKSVNVRLYTE